MARGDAYVDMLIGRSVPESLVVVPAPSIKPVYRDKGYGHISKMFLSSAKTSQSHAIRAKT